MNEQLLEEYQSVCFKFYQKVAAKHKRRSQLTKRLRDIISRLVSQPQEKAYLRTVQPRRNTHLEVSPQLQSLRVTNSSSKNALDVSRSKLSRRSDSSRQKSEGESRFFGVDWVYSSPQQSRVYFFAILAAFIINDNSVNFFVLEDRINQHLSEKNQAIPPILMISINKYWQRIVEIVTKKKSYLWEKNLKEPIDRMPLQFNKLIAKIIAGKDLCDKNFSQQEIAKLSKEGRVNIANFVINCRQIEQVERQGNFASQIIIGYLRHSKQYVVANKIPEYSETEQRHRRAKALIAATVSGLLQQYKKDQINLGLQKVSLPNQKDRFAKDFLNKKLMALKQA